MSIRHSTTERYEFKKGDTVHCRAWGIKESFVGTIAAVCTSGKLEKYYHVRDAENKKWHRDDSDLTLVLAC